MSGRLRLELLGGCRLSLNGADLDLHFTKSRALLCFLAVTGTRHSRDVLTDLLWGESSEGDARANLRVRLSGLRRALAEHLSVTRDAVAFNRESAYELDVEAFLAALQRPDDLTALREAVQLYRGDFLEGFHVPRAPAFETWLAGQRERLRSLVLEALYRLAGHHTNRGEHAQARDDLLHFLSLDPWREEAHRQLMRALALNGQRETAVAQYLSCCRVLAGELGLEPAPETTRLYEQIRAGEVGSAAPALPRPLAERRQLTVISCELTGAGALTDPEELHEFIGAFHQSCAAAVAGFGGVVAHQQGPSITAYFGFPLAHEDGAQRAVRAGLDLLGRMRDAPPALGVRVGIQTGPVIVMPGKGGVPEVVGLTPVAAGRLQGVAEVGELLIGGATERLVRGFFLTEARGSRLLSGLAEPLELHRVRGETAARSRLQALAPRTALVGRGTELSRLRRCWNQARAGRGQAILITGEAGIGKSRLLYALKEALRSTPCHWLETQSSASLVNTPFAPLIDLWEREAGFSAQDTSDERLGKLEAALDRSGLAPAQTLPLLAALLGLPEHQRFPAPRLGAERQRQETLELLVRWVEGEAARGPVVFVVEDLHWCDPSTLDLLERLVERARGTRLLILLTARSEVDAGWMPSPRVARVELSALSSEDTAALIGQLSAGTPLASGVQQALQVKCDGIPLYIEELTREVLEGGRELGLSGGSPVIPSTLQDALSARLDRLGEAREIAQLASVIGRTFSLDLLAATSPTPRTALEHALNRLTNAGLIAPEPTGRQYTFRHALIQDAAYASLLRRTRQEHHARVAQVLAEQFGELTRQQPERLAGHYAAAGLVERALPLWQQAAARALARLAHQEAIGLFHEALRALSTLPQSPGRDEQELTLLLGLGAALPSARGYADAEVETVCRRAYALCQVVGHLPQRFTALLGLAGHACMRAQYRTASDLVGQLLAWPRSSLTPLHLGDLHYLASRVNGFQGELRASLSHAERVLGHLRPSVLPSAAVAGIGPQDAEVGALGFSSVVLWMLGSPDQALARADTALRAAQRTNHLFLQASALLHGVMVRWVRREPDEVHRCLETFILLATEQGFTHWLAYGRVWQGALQVNADRPEGLTLARQGLAHLDAAGLVSYRPLFMSLIAQAHGQAGHPEAALQAIHDALIQVEATAECWWEAELYRLQGELLLALSQPEGAETSFLQAVAVAKGQEAKSLELRATTSLARLWRVQGREDEAHQALAGVYGGFTEGFETRDLQEARRLLETVSVSGPV